MSGSSTGTNWKRVLRGDLGFAIAVAGLVMGLLVMRAASDAWEWMFYKETVPLRKPLSEMPPEFGSYRLLEARRFPDRMESRLGTKNYVSNLYADVRREHGEVGSGLQLHVAYYTGNQEPVSAAHVPEICYKGSGYKQLDMRDDEILEPQWSTVETAADKGLLVRTVSGGTVSLPAPRIPVRRFVFAAPSTGRKGSVTYFFVYNGEYVASRDRIGLQFLDRSSRRVYYAKVEVLPGVLIPSPDDSVDGPVFVGGVADDALNEELTCDFLAAALPEIVACLPDRRQLNPAPDADAGSAVTARAAP